MYQPRPGTRRDQILSFIASHPEGVTDHEIVVELGGINTAAVNMTCREFEARGLITRVRIGGLFRNRPIRGILQSPAPIQFEHVAEPRVNTRESARPADRPWYWEGNVQSRAVSHLAQQRWAITRVADTTSRETGTDIEAQRGGDVLLVTVKGFPEGTLRTQPSTQARQWFQAALFDVIVLRQQKPTALVMVALPRRPTYEHLASATSWFLEAARFSYLWITEDGVEQSTQSN